MSTPGTIYYSKFFPLDSIRKWLSYDGAEPIENREVSFVFEGDRFIRAHTLDALPSMAARDDLLRMEIGSVYNLPMKNGRSLTGGEYKPIHRELVFDLDADDFFDVKDCCGKSEICPKCWPLMRCAIDIITSVLRFNFGFSKFLVVFSGRRGIHIWCCDERARKLNEMTRRNIIKYINAMRECSSPTECPLTQEIFDICTRNFEDLLKVQPIFTSPKLLERFKSIIPGALQKDFLAILKKAKRTGSDGIWEFLKTQSFPGQAIPFARRGEYTKTILDFTFPRLDENVTVVMNHLLKSPFSVHPKTDKISVPIPPGKMDEFPLNWVPTMSGLVNGDPAALKTYSEVIDAFNKFISD